MLLWTPRQIWCVLALFAVQVALAQVAKPGNTPLRLQRVYMDNKTSPHQYRDGFRYPRLDARLHHGDKVQLSSTSHKTWLYVPRADPASPSFRTFGQTSDPTLAATFAIERASLRSPVVSLWCMGEESYVSVRVSDGAVGCFSPSPAAFSYVRIDGQKWWDASRGSLQDPASGKFLRVEEPSPAGTGVVTMLGPDAGGWQLLTVTLVSGYETVLPLVRGVNLGNWFVLERWMSSELFVDKDGKPFQDECSALDEQNLMERLPPETRRSRMEKHWSTWITEPDIRWLADAGINTVRVPFGYWMTHPEPPFIDGQFKYLRKLFRWCAKYNLAILLDFHGLKGSQNGVDSSGNCGACGRTSCGATIHRFLSKTERALNLAVITNLSATFAQEPALLGFGLANEVGGCDRYELMSFYQTAYDLIRSHSQEALVIVGGLFSPSTYPFLREGGMVQDEHMYFSVIGDGATADHRANIGEVLNQLSSQSRWPVLVGEWSLDHHGFDLEQLTLAEQERWLRNFAKAQLQAYEQHSLGWIYWNYKVGVEVTPTWSFKAMCKRGFLPGCVPGFNYGPPKWWLDSPDLLAYFDHDERQGLAGTVTVGPFIVGKTGTNSCPSGSEMLTQAECRQMPKEFGGKLHEPLSVSFKSDPKGCFKFQGNYYYNEHPVGAARADRSPHCKLKCAPNYVAGKNGANACPPGATALSQPECEDVLRDLGSSLFGGALHEEASPAGCFRFGARLYFNTAERGSERIGRTPYCKRRCTIEYLVSPAGTSQCPPGSVPLNQDECSGAVGLLGPNQGLHAESDAGDPGGCFRYHGGFHFNAAAGAPRTNKTLVCKKVTPDVKRWSVHPRPLHPAPAPAVDLAHSPLKLEPAASNAGRSTTRQPSSSTSARRDNLYISGDPGTNACPPGTAALTRAECWNVPEEGGVKRNQPFTEDLKDDPAGCFTFENGLYYNKHPLGAPREKRAPLCKRFKGEVQDLPEKGKRRKAAQPEQNATTEGKDSSSGVTAVFAAVAETMVSRSGAFIAGNSGTNGCPPNSAVLGEAECSQMPKEYGDPDVPENIRVEDSAEDPRGCFQFERGFYYNRHPVGSPRLGRKPYCRRSITHGLKKGTAAVPKVGEPFAKGTSEGMTIHGSYLPGEPGTNSCPPGALPLSELECKSLPQAFTGRTHSPFVEYLKDDPRGCFKYERGFYFNKHPIGAARPGRTPFCKHPSTTLFE